MRAGLHDPAGIEHDKPVHFSDRRQAVCNRNHRFTFHEGKQVLLDRRLDFRVQRGGCFVQNQDRRIL